MEKTEEQRWIIFFGDWLEWDLDTQLEAPQIIWWRVPEPPRGWHVPEPTPEFNQEYPAAACPVCGGEYVHVVGCPQT